MPAALKQLTSAYLLLIGVAVAVQFLIFPFYEDHDADLTVWRILDWLMAAGLLLALLGTFLRKRAFDAAGGDAGLARIRRGERPLLRRPGALPRLLPRLVLGRVGNEPGARELGRLAPDRHRPAHPVRRHGPALLARVQRLNAPPARKEQSHGRPPPPHRRLPVPRRSRRRRLLHHLAHLRGPGQPRPRGRRVERAQLVHGGRRPAAHARHLAHVRALTAGASTWDKFVANGRFHLAAALLIAFFSNWFADLWGGDGASPSSIIWIFANVAMPILAVEMALQLWRDPEVGGASS